MIYYPTLDEKTLYLIKENLIRDPEYLDYPECPYSPDTKRIFKTLTNVEDFEQIADDIEVTEGDPHQLYKKIIALQKKVEEFGESAGNDPKDTTTYLKLATTLAVKHQELLEKSWNMVKMQEFTEKVLQIMEDTLDVDQRTVIMAELERALDSD